MEPLALKVIETPLIGNTNNLALTLPADVWKTIWLFAGLQSHYLVARCVCRRFKVIFSEESFVIENYRLRVGYLWHRNFPLWQVYCDRNVIPNTPSVSTNLRVEELLDREDYKNVTPLIASNAGPFIRNDERHNLAFNLSAVIQHTRELEPEDFIRDNPEMAIEFKQFLQSQFVQKKPDMNQWFQTTIRQELVEIALNLALMGNLSLLKWLASHGLTLSKLRAFCVVINFTLTEKFLANIFPPIHTIPLKILVKITGHVPNPIPLNFVCKKFKAAVEHDFRGPILKFNWGQRCYHVTLMQLAIDQAQTGQLQLLEWFLNKQFSVKPLLEDDKARALTLLRIGVTQMLQGNGTFKAFLELFGAKMADEESASSTHPFYCAYAWAIEKQCQTGLIPDENLELNRLPPIMARFNTGNERCEYRIRMERHPFLAWVDQSLGCEDYFLRTSEFDLQGLKCKWLAQALYQQAQALNLQEALDWLKQNAYFKTVTPKS